jgi:hypothetical protein
VNSTVYKAYAKKYWPLGVALVVVLLFLIIWWSIGNGVTNKGNRLEQGLNAQYKSNVGQLSNCLDKSQQAAGVAKGETAAFDKVITDAMLGRYGATDSANVDSGKFFSAVHEAYPDLSQVGNTFNNVLDVVTGCREDYQHYQEKMASMVNNFNTWRTASWTSRHFAKGFPNDNLQAGKFTGKDALTQMNVVVSVQAAQDAYNTGTLTSQNLFDTPSPSPSK